MPSPYVCVPLSLRAFCSSSNPTFDRDRCPPLPRLLKLSATHCPPPALDPRPQAVATETKKLDRASVPLELEDGELPLNTFSPKKPFKARTPSQRLRFM